MSTELPASSQRGVSAAEGDRPQFVHLHLHTEYSLLDGGNKIEPLLARVKELGMDAVAVTDHGNLHGAIEFYTKAKALGVKPILGIEAYVAPDDRRLKKQTGLADGGFHLVLLAENNSGWQNLVRLSSDSFIHGFYYKPRMDKQTLSQWNEGLIAINGHLGSSIAHHLTQFVQTHNEAHYAAAAEEARWHKQTFSSNEEGEPRFFLELQRHDTPEQEQINPHLVRLSRELDIPLVCDNDAHFLRAEDWDDHDSLCCISMNRNKSDSTRLKYSRELYVKTPQQMCDLFRELSPDAVANTVRIAERCHVDLGKHQSHTPVVKVVVKHDPAVHDASAQNRGSTEWFQQFCAQYELHPFDSHRDNDSPDQLLRQCNDALKALAEAGAAWRYGDRGMTPEIRARLDRELQILADKKIAAYFLIVWDFVNWARQRGIPALARGSGVGTMVGYVLGLSNACPVQYGLLFERFTDPDRSEFPDIDIDICQDGRASVINYVREKYGHVAQIITFGRLKAKAAIKDVSRIMGLSPSEGQRLANLIPAELNITIDEALEKDKDFRHEYDSNEAVQRVVNTARALEHHARHAGVHAAGVVVATEPLEHIVPLCKATGTDDIITQWDGPTCESVGLLKMDFLGLRTLSTIEHAKNLIRQSLSENVILRAVGRTQNDRAAHPLDLERLHYTDQKVLDLFRRADTSGVFQFESGGMRKLLKQMQPDRLEDLIAANALFRPGPMDLIDDYCLRKHGKSAVPSIHPIVDALTAETYGIMVYQEQVMQIVHQLGGIPLRAAYTLIKAISKKKQDTIESSREMFIAGAATHGVTKRQAQELFDHILKFAGYGFNKSHSTGYAIVAYQTAYLKTYFPNQYMAAVLTYESQARKLEDWVAYVEDCKHTRFPDHSPARPHVGVRVLPPDINLSDATFSAVFNEGEPRDHLHGHVRFGLGAIKGIGVGAIETIIAERRAAGPFMGIGDFCERVSLRTANKGALEAMIKSGAFDSIHGVSSRSAVIAALDDAIAAGQSAAEDRRAGQLNIFASFADETPAATATDSTERPLPDVPPWDLQMTLAGEKECLGFHISGHPLDQYEETLREFCNHTTATAKTSRHDARVVLGGTLTRVHYTIARKGESAGQRMAMVTIQDKHGAIEGVVWADAFAKCGQLVKLDTVIIVVACLDLKRGEPQLTIDDIIAVEHAAQHLSKQVVLAFPESASENGRGNTIRSRLQMAAGLLGQAGTSRTAGGGRAADLCLEIQDNGHRVLLRSESMRVVPTQQLVHDLERIIGQGHVRVIGGHVPPKPPRRNGNFRPQHRDSLVGY